MKKYAVALMIILVLFSINANGESYTFTDSIGRSITVEKRPEKVCVLFSSYAEMWLLAGGNVFMTVGESIERGLVKKDILLADKGAGKRIDLETVVYNQPDFIIGSADIPAHTSAAGKLEKAGIPMALFRVESIEDYLQVLRIMTDITGNEAAFEKYGKDVYEACVAVIGKAEINGPKILFVRSGSGYSSAKAKSSDMHFAAGMLKHLGARNIADEIPLLVDGLSYEEIWYQDPEIIFISVMGDEAASKAYMTSLLKSEKWQSLTAVKNGRVYFLKRDLFQYKPNAKWAMAYETLYDMLYLEQGAE